MHTDDTPEFLQVTHTMPEASYINWLKLGQLLRVAYALTQGTSKLELRPYVLKEIEKIYLKEPPHSIPSFEELEEQLGRIHEPVHPMAFVVATLHSFKSLATPPFQSSEDYLITMHGYARMMAVAFGKPIGTVYLDLSQEFAAFDALVDKQMSEHIPDLYTMKPPTDARH